MWRSRTVVPLQIPPDPHRSSPCYHVECGDGILADAQWKADGTQLAFISTSRDHKIAQLRIADAATGAVRTVLEEHAATYYESDISQSNFGAVNWRYLPASNEVIWYSARDDWAHLYLYDLKTGKLKHPITHGTLERHTGAEGRREGPYGVLPRRRARAGPKPVFRAPLQSRPRRKAPATADPRERHSRGVARSVRPLLHRQLFDTRYPTRHGSTR